MKSHRYSELFFSMQGEGFYVGVPSVFMRFWGCNFTCEGFSNTTNKVNIDTSNYKQLSDLPIIEQGCDSRYSWAKEFQHLSKQATAEELCNAIETLCPSFKHADTKQWSHLVITGGEPMLSQTAMFELFNVFKGKSNFPKYVTIETNGTQKLRDSFADFIKTEFATRELLWSISPKLSISGEKFEDAIKPSVVAEYAKASNVGQLKFVVDGSKECWAEVKRATQLYRDAGINWDVHIMAVGSSAEQQFKIQKSICLEALERGYRFAPRVHTMVFGNEVGT